MPIAYSAGVMWGIKMCEGSWHRVNRDRPCPVCGRADWCMYIGDSANPEAAICPRTPSQRDLGESGYFHRLRISSSKPFVEKLLPKPIRSSTRSHAEWASFLNKLDSGPHPRIYKLSTVLGLPLDVLIRLETYWASDLALEGVGTKCYGPGCWAWLMRNGTGQIVGVRLRTEDGFKYSVNGSLNGLFIPGCFDPIGTIYICEGPTTLGALLSWGLNAIGRASCNTGTDYLRELLMVKSAKDVVVVADRDKPDPKTGVRPGVHYAQKLAVKLCTAWRSVKVVQPPEPFKDARDWFCSGATVDEIESLVCQVDRIQQGRCRIMAGSSYPSSHSRAAESRARCAR